MLNNYYPGLTFSSNSVKMLAAVRATFQFTSFCKFDIANSRSFTSQDGQKERKSLEDLDIEIAMAAEYVSSSGRSFKRN